MSSSATFNRHESDNPDYLFQVHRQTMQLCERFEAFSYQMERQLDAVFTEFRKMNERFDGFESRMNDSESRTAKLEQNVELVKVDQLRISNDVHEIKKTMDKILERLS